VAFSSVVVKFNSAGNAGTESTNTNVNSLAELNPWTQRLIGVIQLGTEEPTESDVDYLEEKYS
jgi:hypothetical protein